MNDLLIISTMNELSFQTQILPTGVIELAQQVMGSPFEWKKINRWVNSKQNKNDVYSYI